MEVPRHWRMKNERYNLQGTYDPVTGRYTFGRRAVGEADVAEPYVFERRNGHRKAEPAFEPAER
jgi:hypothetical protein